MSRHFGISNPAAAAISQASNLARPADPQVAPVAAGQSISTSEDTAANIVLTASDANGDLLSYAVVDGPSNGVLTGTAPNLTYTPSANYSGSDSFTFKANDGTADSELATVSITVTAANDTPAATAQSVAVSHNTATAITLAGSDIDGNALMYTVVTNPSNGSLTGTAPNLTYTPNSGYSGSDSFTFKVNDGTVDSAAATVTLSVAAAVDASFASVSLLLKADGVNNSTSFVDSSANNFAISRFGNTKISTAQSKFGGSSAFFDGTGDYLTVAANNAFQLGTGDFSFESWVYLTSESAGYQIVASIAWGTAKTVQIRYGDSGFGRKLQVTLQGDNSANIWSAAATQAAHRNTWVHLAFTRSSGVCRLFVNGVVQNINNGVNPGTYPFTSFTDTSNVTGNLGLAVGANRVGTSTLFGYLDDVRITKGVARYTANFTPPGSLPTSGS
jgi:hypothetical protein